MYKIEINESEKRIMQLALYAFIQNQKRFIKEYGNSLNKEEQEKLGFFDREAMIKRARTLRNFFIYSLKK